MGTGQRGSARAAAGLCALVLCAAVAAFYKGPHASSLSQTEELRAEPRRRLLQAVTPAAAAPAADPANVTEALLLLKAAIDPNGTLANWDPSTNYCTWQGVQCNAEGEPSSLNVANLGLQGQLPVDAAVWTPLASLQSLDIQGNNVTGYVPPQIMEVGSLQNISLANNGLQGTIPAAWGNTTSLQNVDVSSNQLTGTLPESWASLTQARLLNFSANNLGGQIPASWRVSSAGNGTVDGGMTALQYIGFGGNPSLCTASDNGGSFIFPQSYNSPCSLPYIVSLTPTPAPALAPVASPAISPSEVPAASPEGVPIASPTEVPAASPTEVPAASPTEVPAASPAVAIVATPAGVPAASPTEVPAASPQPECLLCPTLAPKVPAEAPGVLAPGPGLPILPVLPLAPGEAPAAPELAPSLVPAPAAELPILAAPGPGPAEAPLLPFLGAPALVPEAAAPAPELLPLLEAPAPVPVAAPVAAPSPEVVLPIIEAPAPVPEVAAPVAAPLPIVTAPAPAPEVVEVATPAPAPLPIAEVPVPVPETAAPVAAPLPEAPAPSNVSQSVEVDFNPGSAVPPAQPSPPAPVQVPTTGINTSITVTGTTRDAFNSLSSNFSSVLANVTGQPANYVNVLGTSTGSGSGAVTGRRLLSETALRRLLQANSPVTINTFVASDNPAATAQQFNSSFDDGSLAQGLQGIGLTLVGRPSVSTLSGATPPSNANTLGTAVPPAASPAAIPVPQSGSSGHSAGWYLVRILPAVLGGLLAILVAILIFFFCCRGRSNKDKLRPSASTTAPGSPVFAQQQPGSARGRSSTPPKPTPTRGGTTSLAEGLMFSHKPNPIFDTNDTQSSRGDDYEVLNLSGDRTGKTRSGFSDFDSGISGDVRWGIRTADPPVGEAPHVPRLDLAETSAQGAASSREGPFDPVKMMSLADVDMDRGEGPNTGSSFISAQGRRGPQFDSGISYRSAVGPGADTQRTAATNEQFESPKDSPRSQHSEQSFASARSMDRSFRTAGSFATAKSHQTDFFDAVSRGGEGEEAFDYDPYPQARGPVPLTPQGEFQNPLFGADVLASDEGHPILDNPIFRSAGSPTPSPPRERPGVEGHRLSSVRDSGSIDVSERPSIGGHPLGGSVRDSGSIDVSERPSIGGHPIGSDLDEEGSVHSSRRGGTFSRVETSSQQTSETHTYRQFVDGHPVTSLDESNATGSVTGHQIGSFEGSEAPGSVAGHRIGSFDGSEAPGSVIGHRIGSLDGSEAPGSVVGHRIGSLDGSEAPGSEGYASRRTSMQGMPIFTFAGEAAAVGGAAAALGAIRGRPVTSFDGSEAPASIQGRPVTSFDGSEGDGSVIGRPISSFDGSEVPRSIQGRPVTSFDGSEGQGSIIGRPIASFDGSEVPRSIQGRPVTSFDGSEGQGSIIGRPIASFDGSEVPRSIQGRPVTSFDGSEGQGSIIGRPIASFDGSEVPGSIQGRPVTSFDGSEGQGSIIGRPIGSFDGSEVAQSARGRPATSFDSEAFGSVQGRAVTSFDSAEGPQDRQTYSFDSSGFGSVRGRPVTSFDSSAAPSSFQGRRIPSFESTAPGSVVGRQIGSMDAGSDVPASIEGHRVSMGSDLPESVQGHRVSMGSDLPESVQGHRVSMGSDLPESVQGHRISVGSDLPASVQGHRISVGSDLPASVQGHRISVGSDLPASVQGHRISVGSDLPASVQGHRISVGSDLPASVQGHRIGSLDGSELPGSVVGHRIGSFTGSDVPGSVQGHRIGSFDSGSEYPASVQGHRIGSFDGSEVPGSVQGHRIGSFDGSDVPGSIQGHRVGSFTGSDIPASESAHGRMITSFDGTNTEAPSSPVMRTAREHPMYSMFSSSRDSFLLDSQEPRMSFDRPSFDGGPGFGRSSSDDRNRRNSSQELRSSSGAADPRTSSSEYHPMFNPRGSTGTDRSSVENRSGLDLGSRGFDARLGLDLGGQRPSDVRSSSENRPSSENRSSSEPRASMAPLPEIDEQPEPVSPAAETPSPHQTATTNPMFGSDADTFSGQDAGYANRNPIFASTGNFTSDENVSPAPSGQLSGGQQQMSGTTHSDIWASGRGRGSRGSRSRPVSESGSLQGHAINPMFGSNLSSQGDIYNSQGEGNEGVTNPVYDSRRSPSSVGFESQSQTPTHLTTDNSPRQEQSENPLFNNESILDTVDSMGGERNPLFDSTTGQPIATDRGQTNVLFGSNILDSFETRDPSSAHDGQSRNPVFDSNLARQTTGRTTSTGRTTTSSSPDMTTSSDSRFRSQPGPVASQTPAPAPAPVEPPLAARGSTRTGGSPPNTGSSTKSQKSPPNTGSSVGSFLSNLFKPGSRQQ